MNFLKKNQTASVFLEAEELSGSSPALAKQLASLGYDLRATTVKIYAKDVPDISLWALSAVSAFAAGIRSSGGRTIFLGGEETAFALEQLGFSTVFDSIEKGER